jgi:hypothetical protein
MTTKIELRRLTRDWVNKSHDGRKRYCLDAHAKVPAGTKLVARYFEDRFGPRTAIDVVNFGTAQMDQIGELLDASEPCEPESWKEFCFADGGLEMERGWLNERVLERLWATDDPHIRQALRSALTLVQETDE